MRVGKATEHEIVGDDLGVGELYDQVLTKFEIDNILARRRAPLTPRRYVAVIFDIVRARKAHGLRPYPAESISGVTWLLARDH